MAAGEERRIISLRQVTKRYYTDGHWKHVLKGITCSIPFGMNMGIVGVNGAGKSTLMRLLAGVEEPSSGEIVRVGSVSWPLGRSFGFSSFMSGEDNVRFIARLYGVDCREALEFVRDFSELGPALKEQMHSYSSGMRGRLGFAVSMAVAFDFYLVDEVVASGDLRFQEKCRRAFDARRRNATLLMISHQPATLQQFCDTAAILHGGILVFYDTVEHAMRAYRSVTGGRPVWEGVRG